MKTQMLNKSIRKEMKPMFKLVYLFAFIALFIVGCSQESNMLSTENPVTTNEPNWISLPESGNPSLKKDVSVSKMVYGDQETLLEINNGYAGGPHGWISITANARFQRYSFWGQRYITMSINDEFGTATFSPSGTFWKPVIYNLTIVGIDLSQVDPATVKFVYMAPDGSYIVPQYDQLFVDKNAGKLQIINARLPHFSRYGFVN